MPSQYTPKKKDHQIAIIAHSLQPSELALLLSGRKVDVRLPGKGNSNCHGARPVHLIITMIKWIRTSRLSIKNSLYITPQSSTLNPSILNP